MSGGRWPLVSPVVAMVGSRDCSSYGRDATETLTHGLVEKGVTIISGMARSIDSCAHRAALERGGLTAAVRGNWTGCCFPSENSQLAERIEQHGTIISPFPLGTKVAAFTFPDHNRLIAALAYIVVVTEAAIGRGSLLTAEAAPGIWPTCAYRSGIHFSTRQPGAQPTLIYGSSPSVDASWYSRFRRHRARLASRYAGTSCH
jgi:DNA protecting protein DprA